MDISHSHSAPATLKDVARIAGVNKVTASIVLSGGQGNTRVSESTRQRIVQAAAQLRYQPNALARSLRSGQTHVIGFYTGGFIDARDLFLSQIVSGLQQGCEQNRRDFLVHGTFRGDSVQDIYAELVNGKVDGLVLFSAQQNKLVMQLADSHLPIVSIASPLAHIPSVTVDDFAGGRLMANHLASKGHRHVVYGTCPFQMPAADRRHDSFCDAARELGMTVSSLPGRVDDEIVSKAERELLSWASTDRPSVLVCWNDTMAHNAIAYFKANGLSVPGDVGVAGFDGSSTAIPPAYHLTTIRAPWHDVALTAVNLLVNSEGKPAPDETILPVELIGGETT